MTTRVRDASPVELAEARSQLDTIGFCQIRSALAPAALEELQDEAIASFSDSHLAERGEGLSYEAYIAALGPGSRNYLSDTGLHNLLHDLLGRSFELRAERSCLTYYLDENFLGPHRDKIDGSKPISVITYLWAESPEPDHRDSGLVLNIYSDGDVPSPQPVGCFKTIEASVVIGHGTRVWHGRPRLRSREKVIALTGSFFSVDADRV